MSSCKSLPHSESDAISKECTQQNSGNETPDRISDNPAVLGVSGGFNTQDRHSAVQHNWEKEPRETTRSGSGLANSAFEAQNSPRPQTLHRHSSTGPIHPSRQHVSDLKDRSDCSSSASVASLLVSPATKQALEEAHVFDQFPNMHLHHPPSPPQTNHEHPHSQEEEQIDEQDISYDIEKTSRVNSNQLCDAICEDMDALRRSDSPSDEMQEQVVDQGTSRSQRHPVELSPSNDSITYSLSAENEHTHSEVHSEGTFDLVRTSPVRRPSSGSQKFFPLKCMGSNLNPMDISQGKTYSQIRNVQVQTMKSALLEEFLHKDVFTRLTASAVVKKEAKSFFTRTLLTILVMIALMLTVLVLPLPVCLFEQERDREDDGVISNWNYSSCLYFSMVTLLTIGLGDMAPRTIGGRLYLVFFGILGLSLVATFIGLVGREIMHFAEHFLLLLAFISRKFRRGISRIVFGRDEHVDSLSDKAAKMLLSPWAKIMYMIIFIFIYFLLGALVFSLIENWNYWVAVYFCFIILSTIGYGDIIPQTSAGRVFLMFYCVGGLGALGIVIGFIGELLLSSVETQRLRIKRTIIKRRKPNSIQERELVFTDATRLHMIRPSVITMRTLVMKGDEAQAGTEVGDDDQAMTLPIEGLDTKSLGSLDSPQTPRERRFPRDMSA